jgi:hypothetical protein
MPKIPCQIFSKDNNHLKIIIMKKFTFLFVAMFIVLTLFAQQGISFQGIARDPQGNAIVKNDISVKFTIGSFTETQNLKTDNFGVFSATIGSVNTTNFKGGDPVLRRFTII